MQPVNFDDNMVHITKRNITLRITNPVYLHNTETKTDTNGSIIEEWKELGSNYPGYLASNLGRIRGIKGRIFNGNPNDQGYVRCAFINSDGQQVSQRVHILVATAFIPNPEGKPIVNHKNGIRHDNRVVNLEWATHSENVGPMKLSHRKGDLRRGIIQYSIDGQLIKIWDSVGDAADTVHSDRTSISKACRGTPEIYRGYRWRYYDEMIKPQSEEWRVLIHEEVTLQVSNLGRIRRELGRIIGSETDSGYIRVRIKNEDIYVHRLVCLAWKPIPNPELYVVNHIDNNGKNNRIENLEWVTGAENLNHYCKSFLVRGTRNYGRAVEQLSKDGTILLATFGSAKEASGKTGVNQCHITEVCRNNRKSAGGFVWQYHQATI